MSESDPLNPYRPPTTSTESDGWWGRLKTLLRDIRPDSPGRFEKGHAIICSGIAFFVDPFQPEILFAASPSADHSDKRMSLIVKEAIQCLHLFAAEYPKAASIAAGRDLRVRMIREYSDSQGEFIREAHLDHSTIADQLPNQFRTQINDLED